MKHETTKLLIKHGADVNNVILPSFCFVEAVFAVNSNLVMMASGVRFHLENFTDLVSLAMDIILAGLTPRMFYLSGKRFILGGFAAEELCELWSFQHLCLILGFKIDRGSLQDAINELNKFLTAEQDEKQISILKDRLDKLCWTRVFLLTPLPLTYLARIAIRGHLVQPAVSRGRHVNDSIALLPLPTVCKNFLNLQQCTIRGIADYMHKDDCIGLN
uniref:SOCS box domain-containing protein n=2 Tax=Arion vulgaris TaxID=1028688 RepID=A0A0B6YD43_9EUPU